MNNDVLVVGGGLAGLTAAYKLQKRGLKVKVLEKESRIGGRAASSEFDANISIGAEFFTTKYTNTINLCKELGIELVPKKAMYTIQFGNSDWNFGYSQVFKWIYRVGISNLLKNLRVSHKLIKAYRANIFNHEELMNLFDNNFEQFVKEVSLPKEFINLVAAVNRLTFHYHYGMKEISTAFLLSWIKNVLGGEYLVPRLGINSLANTLVKKLDVETSVNILGIKKQKDYWKLTSANKTYYGKNLVLATPANISATFFANESKKVFSPITNLLKNTRYSTLRRVYVKVAKPAGKLSYVYVQNNKNTMVEYYSQITPLLVVLKLRPQLFNSKWMLANYLKA